MDQQGTGTKSSHGHDVGSKSSPKHGQEAHEDERPRNKVNSQGTTENTALLKKKTVLLMRL